MLIWHQTMMISVITIVYNGQDTIEDTVHSVASQIYPNVEYIVVDGGSFDGTLEILNRHREDISILISEPDKGIYDAMNKGIGLANGDILGFLNSDDFYEHSMVLSRVAESFEPDIDACYGDLIYVDRKNPNEILRYWRPGDYMPGRACRGWMPPHPTLFLRRKIYERFGGYDSNFRYQADVEMILRLFEAHHIVSQYIPETLVRMRMGGVSTGSLKGIIMGNIEAWKAVRKHRLASPTLFVFQKILRKIPQFAARPSRQ